MVNSIFLAAQAQQGGGMSMLLMLGILFVIMWFFMIRPQNKKQKEIRNFQNALTEGTKIVTGGGVHGTVRKVDLVMNTVDVEIARGVVVEVDKNYVFADTASASQAQPK